MKIALVAALLGQLAAQSPERIETKKLDIVGEFNGKPGAEIVMYRGRPEKPGIDGHYDMTLGPGEKHNNVLVYEALSGPEAPYTELTINGHLMYARLIRGFQWQGTAIERMCIGQGKMPFKSKTPDDEWAEKEAPMLLMAEPGWQRVYFVTFDDFAEYKFGVMTKSDNGTYEGGVLKSQFSKPETLQK